ncbi:MAG: transcriptional regulator NrdR [Gammaproteobacteria bacterium]|nr:transcriptional regulator NrdR [Gammaproteobacteria bacterium]|tara:strand:+ start:1041 stop:1547 length:507 start_codon:yes stop_codon:yes gene_type:complete
MRCPFCGEPDTKVIDSRLNNDNFAIKRRRECLSCKARFNTQELTEISFPRVIKSDKSTEIFSEDKLKKGVYLALEKRKVSAEQIDITLQKIFTRCSTHQEKEITSKIIGEIVMQELIKLDHVAYIRFASVYLSFDNIESFRSVVETLEKNISPEMKRLQQELLDDDST